MNVFIFATVLNTRQVKVYYMHYILDIETSRADTSYDQDRTLA